MYSPCDWQFCTVLCLVPQSCLTLCDPMGCSPPGSSVHRDSPGKNIGVSCHLLFQGIFPTQESNQGLLHCRHVLYQLSYHDLQQPSVKKCVLDCLYSPFTKITYILTFPYLFGAVSQSYLRCYLLGYSPYFAPNKT